LRRCGHLSLLKHGRGGRRGLHLRNLLAATLARAVQDFVKRDALVNLTAVIPIAGV
jgi:hypothetical protein